MTANRTEIYERIARSLRDFGYPDVTAEMVKECVSAYHDGSPMPHGVVGVIIKTRLDAERDDRSVR